MRMGLRARTLAAVSTLALVAVTPALAENVTVTGITAGEGYQLSVPTVEATDTNLTEAQIRRLFTGDFAANASALAELDAGMIMIPEITLTYEVPKVSGEGTEKATVTYRDIHMTDVVDGIAQSTAVGSTEMDAGAGITMTFGAMTTGIVDIGGILGFYGLGGAAAASDEFKTLYADFAFEGGKMTGPGFSCDFGGASIEDVKARPLKTNFNDFVKLAATVDADSTEAPPPEVVRAMIDFYVDILTAFESTPMVANGFTCSGAEGENTFAFSGGTIEMGGFTPGIYPHFAMNDIKVDITGKEAGTVSLGNFTWKKMDFNSSIAALAAAPAELTEAWFMENWRTLIPAIDGLSLANLVVDAPNPDKPSERFKGSIGGFDISLADYVNGIPSKIGLTTSNVLVDVPAAEGGEILHALGITQLDLTQDLQMHWDEAAQAIIVDSVAIDAANFGTIKLSATLGNATSELFSSDNDAALGASMGLTLKDVTINVDDRGASALGFALMGASEGQDPAVMRVGVAGLAQSVVLAFVGSTPEAMAASEEIATFIKTKPQVTVKLTAIDEAGIALPALMEASENPELLAGQFTIAATSAGDARPADTPLAPPAAN